MSDDQLPPHSYEAEKAVLGCILCDPKASVETFDLVATQVTDCGVFYGLQHQVIWQAMAGLRAEGKPIDTLLLANRLRETGKLDACGGDAYIGELPDAAPGGLQFVSEYLPVVLDRYTARQVARYHASGSARIAAAGGHITESQLTEMQEDLDRLVRISARQLQRSPKELVAPSHFESAFFDACFNRSGDEYGRQLPFPFPLRIRPSEMTLFHGDNGSGKSSFLSQVAIVLAKQGAKVCIASMEVPGEVTLWIMARQLLGRGPRWEQTQENIKKLGAAMYWMEERFVFYDFKGITDWRHLLEAFRYSAEHHGTDTFLVDSVMRIGIEDDDFAQQGIAAARFANFALTTKSHLFLVMHERKAGSGGAIKEAIRGSKQWSDNAHNVCRMLRNETKSAKIAEIKEEREHGYIDDEGMNRKIDALKGTWDSKFIMSKQRWPGSQQNASRWLWFDYPSLQFLTHPDDTTTNYML